MNAVVDASAALSWLIPAQATAASRVFALAVGSYELEAPFVFEWEVQNTLLAVFRGQGRRPYTAMLAQLATLDVALGASVVVDDVMALARDARLSLFDACYLRHALHEGVDLISRDRALLDAARDRGVTVHDLT